jgi:uncharacterized protein GlcG (DUF336 family)
MARTALDAVDDKGKPVDLNGQQYLENTIAEKGGVPILWHGDAIGGVGVTGSKGGGESRRDVRQGRRPSHRRSAALDRTAKKISGGLRCFASRTFRSLPLRRPFLLALAPEAHAQGNSPDGGTGDGRAESRPGYAKNDGSDPSTTVVDSEGNVVLLLKGNNAAPPQYRSGTSARRSPPTCSR